MANLRADDDVSYILGRLINQNNAAEGSTLPLRQQGQFRVPFASSFQILNTADSFGGVIFTLGWLDADARNISHYNIYARDVLNSNAEPTQVGTSAKSPCTTKVISNASANVTFFIQTVMLNGQSSNVVTGPTCTGATISPSIPIPPGSITTLELADGSVTNVKIANLTIDGTTKLANASIGNAKIIDLDATKINTGFLSAARINAAALDVTKLNIKQIIIPNLTISDNTPGAGSVSLTSCLLYYNGNSYAISALATTDMFIWWDVGNTTFSHGATFTPQPNRFMIVTNTAGIHDESWNKVGTASIEESHLSFPLNSPYKPLTIDALTQTLNTTTGTDVFTDIVNVSEDGIFYGFGSYISIRTEDAGNNGSFTLDVGINIDGQGETFYPMISGTPTSGTTSFSLATFTQVADHEGSGNTLGDFVSLAFSTAYKVSLHVRTRLNRNGTTPNVPVMQMQFYLRRGEKIV